MGGGKGGSQTSTQTNTPWVGMQPALADYYNTAQGWFDQSKMPQMPQTVPYANPPMTGGTTSAIPTSAPNGPFGGRVHISSGSNQPQTNTGLSMAPATGQPQSPSAQIDPSKVVAGIPPALQQEWDLQTQRALQGSPVTQGAQNLAQQELSGNMLMPSFNAQFDPIAQQLGRTFNDITMPGINSTFSMAGRTGSGAQQDAISNAQNNLGQSLSSLAGNIYGQERGYQQQAMGMAPQLAAQDYADIGQLGAVGDAQRAYQQQLLSAPYQQLQQMGGLLQPGLGFGTSTSSKPLNSNLSGLGTGLGMLGGMALAPATGGLSAMAPYLLTGGALGGGVGGMFGKS